MGFLQDLHPGYSTTFVLEFYDPSTRIDVLSDAGLIEYCSNRAKCSVISNKGGEEELTVRKSKDSCVKRSIGLERGKGDNQKIAYKSLSSHIVRVPRVHHFCQPLD